MSGSTAEPARRGPLCGLRVVEMAAIGPVPLAGQLLADMGAEITVVARSQAAPDPRNVTARGKEHLATDLKSEEGRHRTIELIGDADILLEGFRPGVMERLGLGPEEMLKRNPGLVYGRMTGWGQTGPLAPRAGHDINYLALTGALFATGPAERPVPPLNLVGDYAGGTMILLFGVLSALHERSRSGLGQVVDAAIVDGVPALMGLLYQRIAEGTWDVTRREANRLDGGAPFYRCYETSDGGFMAVGALEDPFFYEFARMIGLEDDLIRERFDTSRWPEMREIYAGIFHGRTRAEWTAIFRDTDACVTPVLTFEEAARDAHVRNRGAVLRVAGVLQGGAAPRLSRTPGRVQ